METYLFTGTITTRQPLAYSPPDHQDRGNRSLLPRMTIPTASGPMSTVFVSGSTIRGKLRHACADVYLERAAARKEPVDYERYLELKVGGVKGSSDEARVGLRERVAFLEAEPFMALFGAGSSRIGWIHSRLDVGAAVPAEQIEPIVLKGVRRDATMDPILLDVLDEGEIDKVLKGLEANRIRSRKTEEAKDIKRQIAQKKRAGRAEGVEELERSLEEAEQAVRKARDEQSDIIGSDVSLLLPLPGYEAIPSGTVLSHRMFLKNVSRCQLGIFMAGLARFAEDPRFGAHRAQGCGQVCVEYRVKRIRGVFADPVGAVTIDPDRWDEDESSLGLSGEPADWLASWNGSAEASQ